MSTIDELSRKLFDAIAASAEAHVAHDAIYHEYRALEEPLRISAAEMHDRDDETVYARHNLDKALIEKARA